jgi:predicted 3-demethylubiquinone-9 3-methyltransferase (glyoxalase superfamily)
VAADRRRFDQWGPCRAQMQGPGRRARRDAAYILQARCRTFQGGVLMAFSKINPCLWFDSQAEEAARYYCSIFKNSKILSISHYGEAGYETHKRAPGTVLTAEFELEGQRFTALNGGPVFKFNEAMSLQVYCDTQEEIDYYWDKLSAGGDPSAQACGWLKDKYGVSWQISPVIMAKMFADTDTTKTGRLMEAMLPMKKLEIAKLKRAFEG